MQVDTDEFTKNPELKKKDLQELRSWLATQEHLPPISGRVISLIFILPHAGSSALLRKGQNSASFIAH
jgi:hypothetical protein